MTMSGSIADIRKDYRRAKLSETDVLPDGLDQFRKWFDEAVRAKVNEPNAMTLATADAQGMPDARIVLLKGADAQGLVFFTNYQSAKGRELAQNPRGALVFFWPELERQVRLAGQVEKISQQESDLYFQSRPRKSRLGAWASEQSAVIPSRWFLAKRIFSVIARYPLGKVPLPPFWGGYRLKPEWVEFWQGRPSRLHDRLRYRRGADGAWVIERLSP